MLYNKQLDKNMRICPRCGKQKKVLYYPLPPVNVIRGYGCYVPDDVIDDALAGARLAGLPMFFGGYPITPASSAQSSLNSLPDVVEASVCST